ncbi:hypothetical protein G7Z17_g1468 [Cylindrodendrum hubeiense]|uniref:Cell division cycle protein 123 n=1 Tax=Cylindrodendrum hubeiense TaxID=595255 RepID=A0A9P5LFD8_9HYPO|nr:hypothetical protein G7Z17_g1468 [Cylindrodendrum hubeiense]
MLLDASARSITDQTNGAYEERFKDEVHPAFSSLHFPDDGLFMRLNGYPLKDGKYGAPGRRSLHSIQEIIFCLTRSERARNDMQTNIEGHSATIDLIFLPFNDRMASKHEYRVYCSPGKGAIAAVSQYCWHKPWIFSSLQSEEMNKTADAIWNGIVGIHQQIIGDLDRTNELDALLLKQGYTFDVFYNKEKGTSALVDLNVFGATSGCRSSLFHWIEDLTLLYGDEEEVEFNVTVENQGGAGILSTCFL